MKSKSGELLAPETLKIIISLICILLLAYLLFSIYSSNVNKQELLLAKATMERITLTLDKLDANSVYSETLTDLSPADWLIIAYTGDEKKPNQCIGQTCLCICEDVIEINIGSLSERQVNECSKRGVCEVVKFLKEFNDIELRKASNPTSIKIIKNNNLIEVQEI